MYARFFRWASDRLAENGVLAFISNRSFIETRTYDGFRKVVAEEFNEIYVLDLGGDVRANPKLSGTTHNVFGIQTGVAISFLVKRHRAQGCRIHYARRPEFETAEEKLALLSNSKLQELELEEIRPDAKYNWINLSHNDFDSLIPIATKDAKAAKKPSREKAIFKLYSLGISTNRDEWVYDNNILSLAKKTRFLVEGYNSQKRDAEFDTRVKWSRNLKRRFDQARTEEFDEKRIVKAHYRPYCERWLYDSDLFIDEAASTSEMFPLGHENISICFSDAGSRSPYCVLAVNRIADLHFGSSVDAYQQVPMYRYADNRRIDNVTDWAFDQFKKQYQSRRAKPKHPITREAIFQYVYGVLHDSVYREKYVLNLKREFPRIPFYADFWQWVEWGKELMNLHIGYEQVEPFKLSRTDVQDQKSRKAGITPKAMLKADKVAGCIVLDSETTLTGIPREAWSYKLGNRSALEWILDQYKEKKPKDPTIRQKFNTYRLADYKEKVIDLLMRVTTVSVRTSAIIASMRQSTR